MAERIVKFCDICDTQENVQTYILEKAEGDGSQVLELCTEHGSPVDALLEKGRPFVKRRGGGRKPAAATTTGRAPRKTAASGRGSGRKVSSVSEVGTGGK